MRIRTLVALAMLAVPASLAAQGGPPQGRGPGMGMGAMNSAQLLLDKSADLSLTAEQTAKIKVLADSLVKLNAPHQAAIAKIRESGVAMNEMSDADRTKMREASMAMRENDTATREKVKAILSAEQWTKAEAIFAAAMPQRRRGG